MAKPQESPDIVCPGCQSDRFKIKWETTEIHQAKGSFRNPVYCIMCARCERIMGMYSNLVPIGVPRDTGFLSML